MFVVTMRLIFNFASRQHDRFGMRTHSIYKACDLGICDMCCSSRKGLNMKKSVFKRLQVDQHTHSQCVTSSVISKANKQKRRSKGFNIYYTVRHIDRPRKGVKPRLKHKCLTAYPSQHSTRFTAVRQVSKHSVIDRQVI